MVAVAVGVMVAVRVAVAVAVGVMVAVRVAVMVAVRVAVAVMVAVGVGACVKIRIINDIHIGATNEINGNPFDPADGAFAFYLGDNFDLANCKKEDVSTLQIMINEARKYYEGRFIAGNHELQSDSDTLIKSPNPRIGLMHGDLIFWGKEKSDTYRKKSHGAGFLKRNIWVPLLESFENGYDRKINTTDLERFYEQCLKYDVDRIIVGHMHPKEQKDIVYKGKTLTVLKRGINEVEI